MANTLFAHCPECKQENALAVRVGKKSTAREASCPMCHARFAYSAWVTMRTEGMVFHQVDLVKQDQIGA